MALRNSEIIVAASGGHSDYSGNEVTAISIDVDAPTWTLLKAGSIPTMDVAYYSDGTPTSRHTYWSPQWSAVRNRVMLHYTRYSYGNAVSFPASNGFSLDANAWDHAGTWSNGYSALCQDSSGNCWASSGYFTLMKWTAATDTWAATATFSDAVYPNLAFDSLHNQLFQLSWGNGEGSGSGVTAFTYNASGTIQTAISFNASAAYTRFVADAPLLAAMDYDPDNDRYLFYDGRGSRAGRIYVITPNSGTTWDMSIMMLGSGSVTPSDVAGAGVLNRFRYVPALKGFVLLARATTNLLFIRTS